jgi:hypothetical protein
MDLFQEAKLMLRNPDYSSASSPEIMNAWRFTSIKSAGIYGIYDAVNVICMEPSTVD